MALTRSDFLTISREIRRLISEYDPAVLDIVEGGVDRYDDPRDYALALLARTARVYSERSSGSASQALDRLNHFVRTEENGPVQGISVSLPSIERELFGRSEILLAELPDRSQFVSSLKNLESSLRNEHYDPEEEK